MSRVESIRLAPEIVQSWRQALLSRARLPKGMNPKTHDISRLIHTVIRSEAKEVGRLWSIFNQEREELSRHLLSEKRSAVAYLLGFHLANAARAQMVLSRAHGRSPLRRFLQSLKGQIQWHDLGCGTGALAQVVMHDLVKTGVAPQAITMHLSDISGTLLDTAREVFEASGWSDSLRTHKYPLEKLSPLRLAPEGETKLMGYSLGYVWNELSRNKAAREKLLRVFEQRLEENHPTLILVLEPATEDLARDAMALREHLVGVGYKVLYPCPESGPCPMLKRSRDWCYSEATWEVPRDLKKLDEMLDMDRSRLSGVGYLLASKDMVSQMETLSSSGSGKGSLKGHTAATPSAPIVVGRPVRTTGRGFDYLLCQAGELTKAPGGGEETVALRGLPLPEGARSPSEPSKTTQTSTVPDKPRRRG